MLNYSTLLIFAAVVPAVLLLIRVYRSDTLEPESPAMLTNLIIAGVLAALLAIVEETVFTYILDVTVSKSSALYNVIMYFLIVAVSEESSKYIFMKRRTWNSMEFNCRFDGIVYAVFTSLGFAIFENISYVFSYGLETAIVRAFTAIPGHACFGVFMGLFYALAKENDYLGRKGKSSIYRKLALIIPVLIHGTYDYIATMASMLSTVIFMFFIAALFFIANKLIKKMSREDHYITWHIV